MEFNIVTPDDLIWADDIPLNVSALPLSHPLLCFSSPAMLFQISIWDDNTFSDAVLGETTLSALVFTNTKYAPQK